MMRIKTTANNIIRKCEVSRDGQDVRITLIKRPERLEAHEDVEVLSIAISRETYITEMRKFLEELEA